MGHSVRPVLRTTVKPGAPWHAQRRQSRAESDVRALTRSRGTGPWPRRAQPARCSAVRACAACSTRVRPRRAGAQRAGRKRKRAQHARALGRCWACPVAAAVRALRAVHTSSDASPCMPSSEAIRLPHGVRTGEETVARREGGTLHWGRCLAEVDAVRVTRAIPEAQCSSTLRGARLSSAGAAAGLQARVAARNFASSWALRRAAPAARRGHTPRCTCPRR